MTGEQPRRLAIGSTVSTDPQALYRADELVISEEAGAVILDEPPPILGPNPNRRAKRAAMALLRSVGGDASRLTAQHRRAIVGAQQGRRNGGRRRAR